MRIDVTWPRKKEVYLLFICVIASKDNSDSRTIQRSASSYVCRRSCFSSSAQH